MKTNRAAIGARIKVTFKENGVERSVYHDLNSGGSFGSNPLEAHIGVGSATSIESIEIKWPVGNYSQVFKNIRVDEHLKIKEGGQIVSSQPRKVNLSYSGQDMVECPPK